MSISHILEDFGTYTRGESLSLTDVSLEELKLEAFEKGYQAGWEDSTKAASDDHRRISADLAQNLQDLSFTYQEAHSAVLSSLRPLLDQMMSTLLPGVLHKTLGAQIAAQIHDMARANGPQPIELVTSPANALAVEALQQDAPEMSLRIIEDDSLPEGQVLVRLGNQEREIDLSGVLDGIEQMLIGFYDENNRSIA